MSDDWDADDFEPPPVVVAKEPVKSSWEDEEEEEAPASTTTASAKPKGEKKKKKAEDKGKGKEKEEGEEVVDDGVLADPVAEKLRQQRLVEESDFKATKELFGGKKKEAERSLDDFLPKSEADFNEFADLIAARITPHSKSFHYVSLIKNILRKVEAPLVGKDAKEISAAAAVIANEKLKAEKEAEKGKKKGGECRERRGMSESMSQGHREGQGWVAEWGSTGSAAAAVIANEKLKAEKGKKGGEWGCDGMGGE
ncbi:unnamed protein product [Closterium sp. Naga37s-1]|nr:unnamed protein product [Closterium sp. Naga37s-1]